TLQLVSKLSEVVDFTVENDPDGLLDIGNGLMTAGQVDDGEPTETQPERSIIEIPFIVGATVSDRPGHRFHVSKGHRREVTKVVLAADSTHGAQRSAFARAVSRRRPLSDATPLRVV